jgi:hypothetical protein
VRFAQRNASLLKLKFDLQHHFRYLVVIAQRQITTLLCPKPQHHQSKLNPPPRSIARQATKHIMAKINTPSPQPDVNRNRLPTLFEVLSRRTLPPVDLFSFYIYMRDQQRSVDYLDFWYAFTRMGQTFDLGTNIYPGSMLRNICHYADTTFENYEDQ